MFGCGNEAGLCLLLLVVLVVLLPHKIICARDEREKIKLKQKNVGGKTKLFCEVEQHRTTCFRGSAPRFISFFLLPTTGTFQYFSHKTLIFRFRLSDYALECGKRNLQKKDMKIYMRGC